jgi:hypothetical protein
VAFNLRNEIDRIKEIKPEMISVIEADPMGNDEELEAKLKAERKKNFTSG